MKKSSSNFSKIGVLTSGGDAPGMNAAIRAIVRSALSQNVQVMGIENGFSGILQELFTSMTLRSVANIIQTGGTILKTDRFPDFQKKEVRKKAAEILKKAGIEALLCIGGNGSLKGAQLLWEENQFPVVGVPGTIDNDISGTESTLGFDTALNTALEAMDRIRDTADSHNRIFIIEVMGKTSGFLALHLGLAAGAEDVLLVHDNCLDNTIERLKKAREKGKKSSLLVAAEEEKPGRAYKLAETIFEKSKMEGRVCILGHIQRGGRPSAQDRFLGGCMGAKAMETLLNGQEGVFIGLEKQNMVVRSMKEYLKEKKREPKELLQITHLLAN